MPETDCVLATLDLQQLLDEQGIHLDAEQPDDTPDDFLRSLGSAQGLSGVAGSAGMHAQPLPPSLPQDTCQDLGIGQQHVSCIRCNVHGACKHAACGIMTMNKLAEFSCHARDILPHVAFRSRSG